MIAPQATILENMWKMHFKSKMIKLPTKFKGWTKQSKEKLFKPTDMRPPNPIKVFTQASMNKYHNKTNNSVADTFEKLIKNTSSGICQQWSTFHSSCKWVGTMVAAAIGIAAPATMMPPGLMAGPLIYARCNAMSEKPDYQRVALAICNAFGTAFMAWQTGLGFYSLPYPSGAVQCTSMIPVPNIPLPLMVGISPGEAMMTKPALMGAMIGMSMPLGNHVRELLDACSTSLATVFQTWKATSMVTQVICGAGVAPPPPSPPGPVAGGLGGGGMLT